MTTANSELVTTLHWMYGKSYLVLENPLGIHGDQTAHPQIHMLDHKVVQLALLP